MTKQTLEKEQKTSMAVIKEEKKDPGTFEMFNSGSSFTNKQRLSMRASVELRSIVPQIHYGAASTKGHVFWGQIFVMFRGLLERVVSRFGCKITRSSDDRCIKGWHSCHVMGQHQHQEEQRINDGSTSSLVVKRQQLSYVESDSFIMFNRYSKSNTSHFDLRTFQNLPLLPKYHSLLCTTSKPKFPPLIQSMYTRCHPCILPHYFLLFIVYCFAATRMPPFEIRRRCGKGRESVIPHTECMPRKTI